jgi:hypothetical protein
VTRIGVSAASKGEVLNYALHTQALLMTKNKQAPSPKNTEAPGGRPENPFLDVGFYARMRDYTERDAAFSKELKAIAEHGAGKEGANPLYAPSLAVLRAVVKKGLSLEEVFKRIVAGVESGHWESWLAAYGFELRGVNYAKTEPRNARLALDLSLGSKATAAFANAGVPNWRSLAAEDCAQVQIEKPTEKTPAKAWAIFVLDAPD